MSNRIPPGRLANIPASRQRRLNSHAIWRLLRGSIVADATVITFHAHRGLKPTAKIKPPLTRRRGRSSYFAKTNKNNYEQQAQSSTRRETLDAKTNSEVGKNKTQRISEVCGSVYALVWHDCVRWELTRPPLSEWCTSQS